MTTGTKGGAPESAEGSREMVCIVCPVGCRLKAERAAGTVHVTGNICPRGERYAVEEMTNPVRTVTTSVPVSGGHRELLSVKTRTPVPKGAIPAILEELRGVRATAPVKVGDVVLPNAAGTGVDIVATRSIREQ
jgi:CxxC motif-containing protein